MKSRFASPLRSETTNSRICRIRLILCISCHILPDTPTLPNTKLEGKNMQNLILCDNCEIATVLPLAKSKGLGIEIQSFYHPDVLDNSADALAKYLNLLEGFDGLRALHGPFGDLCPGSFDPLVRKVTAHRIEQGITIARELDVDHIVLHHGYVPNTSSPANWIKRSCDFWRDILTTVPDTIHIHLENLFDHNSDILLELVQKLGDARMGICLDIGHAHAFSQQSAVDWVNALAANVTYIHLHDNYGSKDEHLSLGQGNLPLQEVLAALETHAPDAIWAIETYASQSLTWLEKNGFLKSV